MTEIQGTSTLRDLEEEEKATKETEFNDSVVRREPRMRCHGNQVKKYIQDNALEVNKYDKS